MQSDCRLLTKKVEAEPAKEKNHKPETGPLQRAGKASGLKPGLELRVCNPPAVGATVNQYSKWKSRLNRGFTAKPQGRIR
jgi:hypothetical protein